ncbi:unnamed protein product, partial [Amoebophrya sp. A25]
QVHLPQKEVSKGDGAGASGNTDVSQGTIFLSGGSSVDENIHDPTVRRTSQHGREGDVYNHFPVLESLHLHSVGVICSPRGHSTAEEQSNSVPRLVQTQAVADAYLQLRLDKKRSTRDLSRGFAALLAGSDRLEELVLTQIWTLGEHLVHEDESGSQAQEQCAAGGKNKGILEAGVRQVSEWTSLRTLEVTSVRPYGGICGNPTSVVQLGRAFAFARLPVLRNVKLEFPDGFAYVNAFLLRAGRERSSTSKTADGDLPGSSTTNPSPSTTKTTLLHLRSLSITYISGGGSCSGAGGVTEQGQNANRVAGLASTLELPAPTDGGRFSYIEEEQEEKEPCGAFNNGNGGGESSEGDAFDQDGDPEQHNSGHGPIFNFSFLPESLRKLDLDFRMNSKSTRNFFQGLGGLRRLRELHINSVRLSDSECGRYNNGDQTAGRGGPRFLSVQSLLNQMPELESLELNTIPHID